MSAPSASGRVSSGVGTVLSTASRAPQPRAISAMAARSVTHQVGLAGVSTQISLVLPGRTAARTLRASVMSTRSTATPQGCSQPASQLRSAQYITWGAITWSPGFSAWNTAVAAAMPEPNSIAALPPSSEASSASAGRWVGPTGRL